MFVSRMHLPAIDLQKWIKVYWIVQGVGKGSISKSMLIPDGCATLVFILNGSLELPYYDNGTMKYGAYIVPPNTESHYNLISDDIFHIDVQFNPGVFYKLFGIPAAVLGNRIYNLNELSIPFDQTIIEQMLSAKDDTKLLLTYLNHFMYKLFSKNYFYEDSLLSGITQLYKDGDVESFYSRQSLSVRQIQRNVKQLTGIGPKAISRISRFYNILEYMRSMPSGSHFSYHDLEAHFSDQSHFIKEFRSFTAATPYQFLANSDQYLQYRGLYRQPEPAFKFS